MRSARFMREVSRIQPDAKNRQGLKPQTLCASYGTAEAVPFHNPILQAGLETHDVVAAVYIDGFAGNGGGEVAGEVECEAADFGLVDVAVKRSALGVRLHHLAQVADAARGERLDRACGDGVYANVLRSEIPGEIARGGLKSRLCDGHYVVVGNYFLSGVVTERHDASAVGHQRGGASGDGD